MRSRRRLAPLLYNSVAVLAGAAATFALVRAGLDEADNADERARPSSSVSQSSPAADRLSFVQPGAFSTPDAASGDRSLRPTISSHAESAWAPSIEVQPGTPAPHWRFTLSPPRPRPPASIPGTLRRMYTLKARLGEIAPTASFRLAAKFEAAHAAWPPAEIALVAIKDEKLLELHARQSGGAWKLIHRYRVLAASGSKGPKLRQGDKQVPEGLYSIAFLNPNSAYHVALRVNYPNAFDRQMAAKDGRKDLGGDIMIHGKNLSAGCLAMGDEAVEELFVLAAQTGLTNIKLIIAPTDLREHAADALEPGQPEWVPKLYAEIATAMSEFKAPRSKGLLSFFSN